MDSSLDTNQLVTYPAPKAAPPKERPLRRRRNLYYMLHIFAAMSASVMAIGGLLAVMFYAMSGYFILSGSWIIYLLALTNLATLSALVLKMGNKNQRHLDYFYNDVSQGMIVDVVHEVVNDSTQFGIIVEGNNRLNEVRRQEHTVTADCWRTYRVGQYVDFR